MSINYYKYVLLGTNHICHVNLITEANHIIITKLRMKQISYVTFNITYFNVAATTPTATTGALSLTIITINYSLTNSITTIATITIYNIVYVVYTIIIRIP